MIIYIDVLIVINIYIGYFLLASAKKLLSLTVAKYRIIAACLISGVSSLIILLELNIVELILIKLFTATLICFVAFWRGKKILFAKSVLIFYLVNFLFGGIMFALNTFFSNDLMQYKNGVCYIDINMLLLASYTIFAYILVTLLDYILKRKCQKSELNQVVIKMNGRETMLTALHDTGNKLVDVFSGLPVMVCELGALEKFLPTKLFYYLKTKGATLDDTVEYATDIRVIPIKAVSGESSLMAFKPDSVAIASKQYSLIVAVTTTTLSDGTYNAIIGNI